VTTDDNTLDVHNLTKRFGPIIAVDDLSFSVAQGEIFGLLGPNGAGKITTIRMLTGLLTPDAGEIRVQGTDVHSDPIRAKMAMGVIPEMSNVYIE
jgi:ABC-type multidrug transport system ATPase subunit